MSKAKEHKNVAIVAEDVDVLVLMRGLCQPYNNWFFTKPGRGSAIDAYLPSTSFKVDQINTDVVGTHHEPRRVGVGPL